MPRLILISSAAVSLGVSEHHLRKLCDRQLVPFERVGVYRVFSRDDLPTIREACERAGYLPQREAGQEAAAHVV